MGGRGTFASGNNVPYTYEYAGEIDGVKILRYKDQPLRNKMPEEAHSSRAYLLFDRDGIFHQYREYDESHRITFEIGYHFEPGLSKHGEPVLHYHKYSKPGIDYRGPAKRITQDLKEKYKKFFKGVKE